MQSILKTIPKITARSVVAVAQPSWHHPPVVTAKEAVKVIRSRSNVFVQGMAVTPSVLTGAMTEHGVMNRLQDINVFHMHTEGRWGTTTTTTTTTTIN